MIADLDPPLSTVTLVVMGGAWVIFVIDYVVNIALATNRGRYFLTHLHEFLIVLLPALAPLRLLQFIAILAVVYRAANNLRERVVYYASGSAALLVFVASNTVLDVERDAEGATITSFGNALWWAIVTITTVGYGDFTPVTMLGGLIAAGLMVCGIALLSAGAGTGASWLLDRGRAQDHSAGPARANPATELDELTEGVTRLRATISGSPDSGAPPLPRSRAAE